MNSVNTQASHPGNGSPHGKKRTFFRRAIGWKSFPARRQAGTSSLQTAGNGQNGSDFASRSTGPLSTTESKPPQGSNQRKTKDYGKKAIDRTRKSGYGHADAQHSVCRIHSLHHPFLAHSLKEAPSPAAAFPQRQAAAIFLPSSRHRQRAKLEKTLGSIADLNRLPSALFVVDVLKEHIAVREANRLGIPVFAMVDTNSNPNDVDFVIPANDDASKSIEVVLDAVCGAIAEGLEERKAEKVDAPAEGEDAPVKKERKTRISRKKAEDAEVAEITDEAPAAEVKEVEE